MSKLTVIILAKNEEQNIVDCINSAKFADDILVIDDFSKDRTVTLAQELGARVIQHGLDGSWEQQKNFAIKESQGEWIFFLDADERISEELAKSMQDAINNPEKGSYLVQRENKFHHNEATHGVLRPDWVLRLCPRDGAMVLGNVHEKLTSPYDESNLKGILYHYTYDNWDQYFRKFNQYTSLLAIQYQERNKKVSFVKDIIFRPLWAFIKMYILHGGFKDGKMGYILSVNHYFYTMTKYVKLYYLYKSGGKL